MLAVDSFSVVFEDNFLIVIDKPAGVVVTPAESHKEPTVAEILQEKWGISVDRGGVVHRLDKETSGLLVCAKTQEVLEHLQGQFKGRTVSKEYMALAHGVVGEIGAVRDVREPIGRNPENRERFVVTPDGKEAETGFKPEAYYELSDERIQELFPDYSKIQIRKLNNLNYKKYTLVRCFPKTGRTHQIRVHLKYIDHPIAGDSRYVGRKMSRLDNRWISRQFLHAAKLSFDHPETGKRMEFESPLPDDLRSALTILDRSP